MYLYYGLAGMRIRLCKPYYITTMQISQMVVGIAVCVAGGYYIAMGEDVKLAEICWRHWESGKLVTKPKPFSFHVGF